MTRKAAKIRALPVNDAWFSVTPCAHNISRIQEPSIHPYAAGDIFLVRGKTGALLIDTGTGMVPPAPSVNAIAMMPVTAVCGRYYATFGRKRMLEIIAAQLADLQEISQSPPSFPA